jgi:hypothetical protein
VVVLAGATLCVPLVASLPLQPSLPTQADARWLDHLSVVVLPGGMVPGEADMATVGGAGGAVVTVTSVDARSLPPDPVQVRT